MDTLQLDPNKRYTYADYLTWNGDERYELLRGFVSLMSAPWKAHQELAGHLYGIVYNFLFPRKKQCEFFFAPFDVRLPQPGTTADDQIYTVVQPDLTVVCDPSKLDERGCIGAPDLVVEIISPSSINKDTYDKKNLYEEAGVKEYWIVHPNDRIIQQFSLNEAGCYANPKAFTTDAVLTSTAVDGLEINLGDLFDRMSK